MVRGRFLLSLNQCTRFERETMISKWVLLTPWDRKSGIYSNRCSEWDIPWMGEYGVVVPRDLGMKDLRQWGLSPSLLEGVSGRWSVIHADSSIWLVQCLALAWSVLNPVKAGTTRYEALWSNHRIMLPPHPSNPSVFDPHPTVGSHSLSELILAISQFLRPMKCQPLD
jgi:hypothetical protein